MGLDVRPSMLHSLLLAWFEGESEDLPWRQDRHPYRVWLSEIMLQQTQVATVIPYFKRFLERFPTVEDLARAPLDDVLKIWEGLGYYSRARNLHRTAQIVAKEYGGNFPASPEELQKLPGIGRYTAGAIASIAYGVNAPVLDGNVIRVLSRIYDIADDVTQPATQRALWALAERLVPPGQAGAWNEALMDLGRRICTPRDPRCAECPVNTWCDAFQAGTQRQRPVRPQRVKTPHFDVTAAVIRRADGQVLIAQRPPDAMLGGLWEFPGGKREPGETLRDCLAREIREELGIEIRVGEQIGVVRHGYTHFRITLYAFYGEIASGEPRAIGCAAWTWATLDDLDRYAFPVTDRKIIALLRDGGSQLGLDLET
ncbi:MAG TPA: A/G-specific adenine glycosylase [Aggregatilineaceae bacterium]|nr:A/G-specific adenine glycosylase [Aggregatilineaceae bacterium]